MPRFFVIIPSGDRKSSMNLGAVFVYCSSACERSVSISRRSENAFTASVPITAESFSLCEGRAAKSRNMFARPFAKIFIFSSFVSSSSFAFLFAAEE